jgi:phage FluMu protein Com
MPISVVCTGCKKRFSVSEKFAGQKGPCPSCKTIIQIPSKAEEVVVHAPESAGPKDSKGGAVIKPILREETRFDPKIAVAVVAAVILLFVAAYMVGNSYDSPTPTKDGPQIPWYWKALAAVALGPVLAASAYSFLRNDEYEPYRGQELWIRAAGCGVVYALLWGVFTSLPGWLGMKPTSFETFQLMYVAPPFVAAGAFAAYVAFELEPIMCALHYGLYLLVTVALRATAGLNALGTA